MSLSRYFFGKREYRELTPIEKAVRLVRSEHLSQRTAAETAGVTRGALQRAMKALDEQREIGQIGRPRLLSATQQEAFDEALDVSLNPKKRVKYEDARQLVRTFCHFFLSCPQALKMVSRTFFVVGLRSILG